MLFDNETYDAWINKKPLPQSFRLIGLNKTISNDQFTLPTFDLWHLILNNTENSTKNVKVNIYDTPVQSNKNITGFSLNIFSLSLLTILFYYKNQARKNKT